MLQKHPIYAYFPAGDVQRARRFYEQTLGFTPNRRLAVAAPFRSTRSLPLPKNVAFMPANAPGRKASSHRHVRASALVRSFAALDQQVTFLGNGGRREDRNGRATERVALHESEWTWSSTERLQHPSS